MPTWIPRIIIREPPITNSIEPIPWFRRIPVGAVALSSHLILHTRFRNRRAEVILCFDNSFYLLTQHDWFSRRVYLNLIFRLLVFFHTKPTIPQITPTKFFARPLINRLRVGYANSVTAELRIFNKRILTVKPAELIRPTSFLKKLFILGIIKLNNKITVGKSRRFFLVILRMPDPDLELHLVPRPINRSVTYNINLLGPVFSIMIVRSPYP